MTHRNPPWPDCADAGLQTVLGCDGEWRASEGDRGPSDAVGSGGGSRAAGLAVELLTLDQINAAADRVRPVMRLTPGIASRVLSDRTGEQVRLKCENLQRTGSFKARAAYNRIANLTAEDRAR